jgi:ferrous iron transport protein B
MSLQVALIGMPNVGKTALFNKLTGSQQRVANFPGVTVEKKTGNIGSDFEVIDLPGVYSLDATTLDEKVTKDFLLGKDKQKTADIFILVLDATHLDKSLYLALQLKKLGHEFIIALNLIDEARKRKFSIDLPKLAELLKSKVIPVSAATGEGVEDLKAALKLITINHTQLSIPPDHQKLFRSPKYVNGIFQEIDQILKEITLTALAPDTFSERIDRVVLHPVGGFIFLMVLLIIIFQTLFTWSAPLQDLIEVCFNSLGEICAQLISQPILRSLVVDGIISGVGGVLVFMPQILLLFLFVQILEDVGYLGRAAFLMDSIMRKIGLPGKAVIPLLSSHACAIPGIMSARIIDNHRERLITMMVIPLTTCSARLPVYAILIAALIPDVGVAGLSWLRLPGLVLFGLYLLGFFSALIISLLFKKTMANTSPSMLLMELPPYRIPKFKNLYLAMKSKARIFLSNAGGIILTVSLVIWLLVTFPLKDGASNIEQSYAADIGRFFQPVFSPLGFDWKLTTALIPSIAAREVVVSALSMVVSIEEGSQGFESALSTALVKEFGLGSLVALLIWFVFAPQCISTFAVLKRETNSLKWPVIMVIYTMTLAYFFAWLARMLVNLWF